MSFSSSGVRSYLISIVASWIPRLVLSSMVGALDVCDVRVLVLSSMTDALDGCDVVGAARVLVLSSMIDAIDGCKVVGASILGERRLERYVTASKQTLESTAEQKRGRGSGLETSTGINAIAHPGRCMRIRAHLEISEEGTHLRLVCSEPSKSVGG